MQVKVANIPGKKVEHQGIKVQLLGQIELASERGHPHTFISLGASSSAMAYCWAASASAFDLSCVEFDCTLVAVRKGITGGCNSSPRCAALMQ